MQHALNSLSETARQAPVAEICHRLSEEVELLRAVTSGMEKTFSQAAATGDWRTAHLSELQNFDLLLQHLSAMRDFLTALSLSVEAEVNVDATIALSRIGLEALRRRLLGVDAHVSETPPGEVELW